MLSLREGTVDARSAAAERLLNKTAEDESVRTRTTSLGAVQPLVSFTAHAYRCVALQVEPLVSQLAFWTTL